MSAKLRATITRMSLANIPHTAASREDPAPKLWPVTRMPGLRNRGLLRTKLGSSLPSSRRRARMNRSQAAARPHALITSLHGKVISHSGRTRSFDLSKLIASVTARGDRSGERGAMYILWFIRGVVRGLITPRYRPELHYMRGRGPKWIERHGTDRRRST
jgi:hypothetical protein